MLNRRICNIPALTEYTLCAKLFFVEKLSWDCHLGRNFRMKTEDYIGTREIALANFSSFCCVGDAKKGRFFMYSSVHSGGLDGIDAFIANVEVDVARALPGFDMVGKLSNEVREARERVKVAIKNCGIDIPPVKITVNISPADIRKSGTAYDLPIALAVLNTLGHISDPALEDMVIIGELGLMGDVGAVSGVLPILRRANKEGITRAMVPVDNLKEAVCVEGMDIIPVHSLDEAIGLLRSEEELEKAVVRSDGITSLPFDRMQKDFADVVGQEACIRAALIAAAGFHHMLIMGPPGAGKTMIAERMSSIMPDLTPDESLEVSTIYSISGLLTKDRPYINTRPFLSPHHTTTLQALAGGGQNARPGMVTLSHRGILFLDELPEFNRECIEILREPLEQKKIQIARARRTFVYPADFMLIAAANPCPCGYYPDRNLCNCSENMILRYRSRISGPVRDRIDIIVSASRLDADRIIEKRAGNFGYDSADLKNTVDKATAIQKERFKGTSLTHNSDITSADIDTYCRLGVMEKEYMKDVYDSVNLTARSYHKLLKVARTIADIEGKENIEVAHLSEALCYRG